MKRCVILLFAMLSPPCFATEIPVFRYALERWIPEPYQLVVTHSGDLDESQNRVLKQLHEVSDTFYEQAYFGGGNLIVREINLDTDWEAMNEEKKTRIKEIFGGELEDSPSFILLSPYPQESVWSGELNAETLKYLVDSPARQAIIHHVMRGITGVWLMINGADSAANDKAEADIRKYSGLMKDEFPPPRIGESYKYGRHYVESDVPLLLEFEVIRIDATNPKEQCLIQILKSPTVAKALEIDPAAIGVEPVAIPVFGRGRTFYGLMGDEIEEENVMGFCAYLLGNCSCQVKMQNPGIDLLCNAQWLAMLVGEEKIPTLPTKEEMLPDPVVEAPQTLPTGTATSDQKEEPDTRVWGMVGGVLIAFLAFLIWAKKSSSSS